jgi:aspartate carbamoyltransferase catalytic subunit
MVDKLLNLVDSRQLSKSLMYSLFKDADSFRKKPRSNALEHKTLALLFYEPSTRTRFSFESAMLNLGGRYISTENAKEFSSVSKGESLEDTVRIVAGYAQGIVIRHYETGAAARAVAVSNVPVINGGDGKGQHPTQALLDIYTIQKEIGRLDNLSVACVGDLASGRTVRSLCYLLGKFDNIKMTFISPRHLRIGKDIKDYLKRKKVKVLETEDLNGILPKVDIVYMTRIQKERISQEDYEKARGKYVINAENLKLLNPRARLMHPLPHIEEIDLPIKTEQKDPRVAYFRQAENGLYIRMALLNNMLGNKSDARASGASSDSEAE